MIYFKGSVGEDGSDQIESMTIVPRKPSEDTAMLLVPEFKYLLDMDFKNFNYFSFETDIGDMTAQEFEFWYASSFEKWLVDLDEHYLDLDFENIYYRFSDQEEKRVFLLKIVNFVMFLLPYQILREVFQKQEIDSIGELKDFLAEEINLINLREFIIEELDKNMTQFDDFVTTLLRFEKIAKKNLVEENIELLDEHVKRQNLFLEIFKGIMLECDMMKFKDLIEVMIDTDSKNLI